MLISRPIVAIQRTKMSNHSDDAENDVNFWGLSSIPSLGISLSLFLYLSPIVSAYWSVCITYIFDW